MEVSIPSAHLFWGNMVALHLLAFKYLFTRPKLFFLGLFPGIFTFACSAVIVYFTWTFFLSDKSVWITLPIMAAEFFASWLLLGNLALIPVEDLIIDEVQKAHWGEVRIRGARMSLRRILQEIAFSILLAWISFVFILLSFVPALGIINFVIMSWLTAYSFSSTFLARREPRIADRCRHFFKSPLSNLFIGTELELLLFVPVLNVFLLGYAQILATLFFILREPRASALSSKNIRT